MIPAQLIEQLSTALAQWDGRGPSDDDTLEADTALADGHRGTSRPSGGWCGDLLSASGVGLRTTGFRRFFMWTRRATDLTNPPNSRRCARIPVSGAISRAFKCAGSSLTKEGLQQLTDKLPPED